jgi:putative oxidoreductase
MSSNKITDLFVKLYLMLVKAGDLSQILLLLFFRLNWGWQFFVTGKGKLLNHPDIVDFFTSLHLPFPNETAWFVACVECFGGILLILGLAARPVGLILATNMTVAYLSVEDERKTVLNFGKEQDPFLHADPFFYLLTGLLAFCFGAGPLSIDGLIKRIREKKIAAAGETAETLKA